MCAVLRPPRLDYLCHAVVTRLVGVGAALVGNFLTGEMASGGVGHGGVQVYDPPAVGLGFLAQGLIYRLDIGEFLGRVGAIGGHDGAENDDLACLCGAAVHLLKIIEDVGGGHLAGDVVDACEDDDYIGGLGVLIPTIEQVLGGAAADAAREDDGLPLKSALPPIVFHACADALAAILPACRDAIARGHY